MNKNKILVTLVVVLLLTNAGMLYYFTKPAPAEKKLDRNQITGEWSRDELGFSEEQAQRYVALLDMKDSIMQPLNDTLRMRKLEMIALVRDNVSNPDSIYAVVKAFNDSRMPIELAYVDHLFKLKALCQPNQLKRYDSTLIKFVNKSTGMYDTLLRKWRKPAF